MLSAIGVSGLIQYLESKSKIINEYFLSEELDTILELLRLYQTELKSETAKARRSKTRKKGRAAGTKRGAATTTSQKKASGNRLKKVRGTSRKTSSLRIRALSTAPTL